MKKIASFVFLALIVCGMAFAQTAPATTTVEGTLGLSGGRIVLKSGGTSYYTRGLERFIGFIDGLKEGAQVSIEGYVSPPSLEGAAERLLFPVKLTLDGKEYEVGPALAETRGRRYSAGPGRIDRGDAGPLSDETRGRRHQKSPGRTGRDTPRSRRSGCW
jgi:hypothetical protein